MFLQLIGEARLLGSWSAADWGDRKKVNFVSVRATPNTTSECQRLARTGDENGTRPLERELLILGRQAPLVVKPYKKGHILTVPISPCPKDKFVVAREKRAVDGSEMQSCCYD